MSKQNMEYVIVYGGEGLVEGMAVLSAEDTDAVCKALNIKDEDRESVLLVKDYDSVQELSPCLLGAHWSALVRPDAAIAKQEAEEKKR